MLRKFKISIDGKEYLVEMEEIGGVPQPAPVAPQPTAPVADRNTSLLLKKPSVSSTASRPSRSRCNACANARNCVKSISQCW